MNKGQRRHRVAGVATALLLGLLGLGALNGWLSREPTADFRIASAHRDGEPEASPPGPKVRIGEFFESFDGTASTKIEENWPWFRGASFDQTRETPGPLAESWPQSGPPELWKISLGEGHAGAAVWQGCVYVLDYLEDARRDALRCFSMDNGQEIWRRSYDVAIKRNHGMSRTIPALSEKACITLGPKCQVMAVRPATGDLLWGLDLVATYGTEVPGWYAGQCPFIDHDTVVLAPAGTNVLMTAIDVESGTVLWETPNPKGYSMSHSSVTPWTFGGRRMYVYAAIGGIVGIAADGPDAGRLLWEHSDWTPTTIAPSPVVMDDGRLFMTAGYGAGSMLMRLQVTDDAWTTKGLFKKATREGIASEQQTPLYFRDHLFAVMPSNGGALKRQLICSTPDGELAWASGVDARFGIGPLLRAGDRIFVLDDDGVLTMLRATLAGYEQMAQAQVLPGHDSWAPLAMVDGRLLLRDSRQMVCLDLRPQ